MKKLVKYSLQLLMVFLLAFSPLLAGAGALVQAAEDQSQTSGQVAGNDQLLDEIKKRGVIKLGVSPDYPPFEFLTREGGENKTKGIDISLAEKIADDLGVKLEIVNMEFSSLMSSLETGAIDMIISGMTYTEERDKSVDFTKPYENAGQSLVIRKDDTDRLKDKDSFVEGTVVGVQQGSYQEDLAKAYMPKAKLLTMQQVPDLLSALGTKQVDGVLVDEIMARTATKGNDQLTYVDAKVPREENDGKAVVIPENQPSLGEAINHTIDEVVEQDLVNQWADEAADQLAATDNVDWMQYWPFFWDGIKTTLLISILSIVFGMILGSLLAVMRISNLKFLSGIAGAYVEFVRGTPLMIQVLFIFLGVGGLLGISPLLAGLIAVSLNSGAYICEIIRGGLQSVPKGQAEAARSLGLDYKTTLRKIIFPQSLRSIWPSLGNEFVTLIKESSIVSTIGVAELTFQTRAVTSQTYQGIIPLFISMVIYFIITYALTKLLNHYEKQMNAKYN
ncbi:ABC transporter substrate-binding protein/permease [Aerococcus sp. UMB7834]|uniref:ABC transporter substrate-binding protein/permease n=1 Tax=Aerococcus sp. UMB7834 TaxID=3046342 RepID=UPI00254D7D0E|nr:ABC transporter substrate-binding protein/permease [Aerococcus sp. UMB7834]MDK6804828.1 ABC transporter substrate-binding protein/permease [Aerococcus sp. UMB7834]